MRKLDSPDLTTAKGRGIECALHNLILESSEVIQLPFSYNLGTLFAVPFGSLPVLGTTKHACLLVATF